MHLLSDPRIQDHVPLQQWLRIKPSERQARSGREGWWHKDEVSSFESEMLKR